MVLAVIPDVTRLVIEYLKSVPEVTAFVEDRIADRSMGQLPMPCLIVTRIGGTPITDAHWGMGVRLQIEARVDLQQAELSIQIAATAQAAMANRNMTGVHDRGVVSGVSFENDVTELPSPDTGVTGARNVAIVRPRAFFDARVFVHPHP